MRLDLVYGCRGHDLVGGLGPGEPVAAVVPDFDARVAVVSWPTLSKDPRQVYTDRSSGPGRNVRTVTTGPSSLGVLRERIDPRCRRVSRSLQEEQTDDIPDGREDVPDLGGERSCWLDEVCVSCGAVDGHRPGCEFAEPADEMVTLVARISTHASGPVWSISPVEPDGRTL